MGKLGFHGKLPSRGDFVQRELPAAFVQAWDEWLARGLAHAQARLGEDWLEIYLTSPLWRFALTPGLCGPDAVVGVMMPSVDRVGRYFPLTVAMTLPADADLAGLISGQYGWFAAVEEAMLATLEEGASFEGFEAAVAQLQPPPFLRLETQGPYALRAFAGDGPEALALALARLGCASGSFWWGAGSQRVAPGLRYAPGMPEPGQFVELLNGSLP